MNKKVRLKKKPIIILIIVILIIVGIIVLINYINYLNSNGYKLKKLGYNEDDVAYILKLKEDDITKILSLEYDEKIIKLYKQKYFLSKNLDKYLNYSKENNDVDLKKVVALVNTNAYKEFYQDPVKTDISKEELMLVNKFHYLDDKYSPKDIVNVPIQYAYEGHSIKKVTYDNYLNMWNQAKQDGHTLIINSSYRSYKDQKETYNYYKNIKGEEYADGIAAREGFSEHQTGYAIDIITYNTSGDDFDKTDTFKWLQQNAYKYGFILRYPKDKEDITGYAYESWHYRYVGVDAATTIHNEDITFDEYYAYYIEK